MFLKSEKTTSGKVIFCHVETESGQSYSSGWSELFKRWSELFNSLHQTVEIHDVFENGAVAHTFFTFWSSQNSGNSLLFELANLEFDSEINKSQES